MLPPFNPHPLHSTKEIRGHPFFQGAISRWLWRFYTHRMTKPGLWFLGMTVAFAMYGATSLELQVFVPFTYATGLWLLALIVAQARPPRVSLAIRCASRLEAGRRLPIEVEARAEQRSVFDAVLLPRRLPPAIDAEPLDGVFLGTLRPGKPVRVHLDLLCTRRGLYTLRGFRVQTDFPFGLLRTYTAIAEERSLLVYPQFTPLADLRLPIRRSDQPGGEALSTTRGESQEFIGNREFREGDSIRDINWQATARLDRLVVREFREEYFHRIALVLDTELAGSWTAFEEAVSLCAAASDFLARQEYRVDCLASGPNVYDLGGGHAMAGHDRALDILATVRSAPMREPPPELLERGEQISLALCFFLDWDDARRAFTMSLERTGVAMRIVIVRDGACTRDPFGGDTRLGVISTVTPAQVSAGLTVI